MSTDANATHIDNLEPHHVEQLVELFQTTWWAAKRDRAFTEQLIAGSDLVHGVVEPSTGTLLGFCRVLTDGIAIALVLDVVVHPLFHRRGIGTELVAGLMQRQPLPRVDSVELVCQPDVVPFYERLGFSARVGESRLMRRTANPLLAVGASNGI